MTTMTPGRQALTTILRQPDACPEITMLPEEPTTPLSKWISHLIDRAFVAVPEHMPDEPNQFGTLAQPDPWEWVQRELKAWAQASDIQSQLRRELRALTAMLNLSFFTIEKGFEDEVLDVMVPLRAPLQYHFYKELSAAEAHAVVYLAYAVVELREQGS